MADIEQLLLYGEYMRTSCSRCGKEPVNGQAYCRPCKNAVQREYRQARSKGPRWPDWRTRLEARLEQRGSCLVALHGQDSAGYPLIYVEGRQRRVHNVWWETHHGPIPEGLEPDHYCSEWGKTCLTHLELVTHAENIRRAMSR